MENNALQENDLPRRLVEALLEWLGAEDPVTARESIKAGVLERLEVLLDALPAAERLARVLRTIDTYPARNNREEDTAAIPHHEKEDPDSHHCAGNDCPSDHRAESAAATARGEDDATAVEKLIERLFSQLTSKADAMAPPASAPASVFHGKDDSTPPFPNENRSREASRKKKAPYAVRTGENDSATEPLATLAQSLLARLADATGTLSEASDPIGETTRTEHASPEVSGTPNPPATTFPTGNDSPDIKDNHTQACSPVDSMVAALLDTWSEGLLVRLSGTPNQSAPPESRRTEAPQPVESPTEASHAIDRTEVAIFAKLLKHFLLQPPAGMQSVAPSSVDSETASFTPANASIETDYANSSFRKGDDSATSPTGNVATRMHDAENASGHPCSVGNSSSGRREADDVVALLEYLLLLRTLKNPMR